MAILGEDGEVNEDVVSDVTGVDIPDVETEVVSDSRYARVSVSEVGNDVNGVECWILDCVIGTVDDDI